MYAPIHLIRGIFPVPRIQLHHGRGTTDGAALGRDAGQQDTIGLQGIDDLRIRIVRYDAANAGIEVAQFLVVVGSAYAVGYFFQTQVGDGQYQSGINLPPPGVDNLYIIAGRDGNILPHLYDLSIVHGNRAAFDDLAIPDMDGAARDI